MRVNLGVVSVSVSIPVVLSWMSTIRFGNSFSPALSSRLSSSFRLSSPLGFQKGGIAERQLSLPQLSLSLSHGIRSRLYASTSGSDGDEQQQLQQEQEQERKRLESVSQKLNEAIEKCQPEFIKTCKVKVAPSPSGHRLGLVATEAISNDQIALSIPYDDQLVFTPELALNTVFQDILPKGYDGWTGDVGLIALLLLNELAQLSTSSAGGIPLPKRKPQAASLIRTWIQSLPTPSELTSLHPLLWEEDYQEILQSSSTKKVYRLLDDLDEDASWLIERVFSTDPTRFPPSITLPDGSTHPCFSREGFAWAVATASSRSAYIDGTLRLIPIMDFANHADVGTTQELRGGFMGTFGTTKGATLSTGKSVKMIQPGQEVMISYGPKSSADYLLEHGFVPTATIHAAELSCEIDPDDRFYDDKLDILEFETYESAPMEPSQRFDVVSEVGRGGDGEPDPAMMQFLRLAKLGGMDAFLLEAVFRKEVWGFMAMPVSEKNEREALDWIVDACTRALSEMEGDCEEENGNANEDLENGGRMTSLTALPPSPVELCAVVRDAERKALTRTLEYVNREKEALDLKEYYQERRLKDLGLDSEWTDESEASTGLDDDELGFGATRAPGSLDW